MLKNLEGQRVPDVTFQTRTESGEWKDVATRDVFAGKKVVAFALPGAFTPTCSGSHLPRYNELAPAFKQHGVDEIACISVNDPFVMNAWAAEQHAHAIRFLPDGNGDFTRGMGMLVDKRALGFGQRSWRYSMLVNNSVIKKMFIEPEVEGDPFQISDADTMLKHLDSKAPPPHDVLLVTRPGCAHSAKAKRLLDARGWAYDEVRASPR